jgi:hypothetical protein
MPKSRGMRRAVILSGFAVWTIGAGDPVAKRRGQLVRDRMSEDLTTCLPHLLRVETHMDILSVQVNNTSDSFE